MTKFKYIKADLTSRPTKMATPALTKPELTPWYPSSVTPVRAGMYERKFSQSITGYARWDGEHWLCANTDMREAAREQSASSFRACWWRGLSANPERSGNK